MNVALQLASVLSCPPVPHLVLPLGIIDDMISPILWTGEDKCNGAQCKVAWDVVTLRRCLRQRAGSASRCLLCRTSAS
jgi:hypothetical protein